MPCGQQCREPLLVGHLACVFFDVFFAGVCHQLFGQHFLADEPSLLSLSLLYKRQVVYVNLNTSACTIAYL